MASHILSLNLKRLSAHWQQRYGHPVILAETYVHPERFEGACYRAANWVEIGATKGFGRARLDFYQLHQNPKAIFICPLVGGARQILCAPVMPGPWAAFCHPADPSKYPLSREQTTSLLEALAALKDPWRHKGWKHRKVASIVAIATASAADLQRFRRGHWAIETGLHYVRDVTFGEDASTVRTGHAPQNLAALRNLVIGLCALDGARQNKKHSSLPRFRAAANNNRQKAIDLLSLPVLNGS
jgi:predicted transposase YbfD/YdcC